MMFFRVEKYSTRKILGLGLRFLKVSVSVSEGVVSVSNGQVLVSVSVSNDEAETPSLSSSVWSECF